MRLLRCLPTLCCFAALLAFLPADVNASYEGYQFFEIVGGAEIVVAGTIESLNEQTYVLRVDQVLGGQYPHKTIEVARFNDWACAWRYGPYIQGESLVAFLVKSEAASQRDGRTIFQTMGLDTNSECPVSDGFVYFHSGLAVPDSMRVMNGRLGFRDRLPVAEFYSAVAGYRSLYHIELGKLQQVTLDQQNGLLFARRIERRDQPQNPTSPFRARQVQPDYLAKLRAYARKSLLHRHLVDSTELAAAFLKVPSIGWKPRPVGRDKWPTAILYRATAAEPSK